VAVALPSGALPARAEQQMPTIVVFWGDDSGMANVSVYTMGYPPRSKAVSLTTDQALEMLQASSGSR
jgi:hypothetical protein